MTQPAPPQAPAPQQQQSSALQIAVLAGLLASTVPLVGLAAGFATLTGLPKPAARRLLEQAPSRIALAGQGPAGRLIAAGEPTYRAAYLLNAAARVKAAMAGGKTLEEALAAEQRFTVAHLNAQANRATAAAAVDKAAAAHRSGLLGWKAVMDSRTSAECRANNGANFSIVAPPVEGYPGAVHPHCRCRAIAPFVNARVLGVTVPRDRIAATA